MKRFLNEDFEKFGKNIAQKIEACADTADVAGLLGDYPVLLSVSMFKERSRVLLEYCCSEDDDDENTAWVKVYSVRGGMSIIKSFYLSDSKAAADFIIRHSKMTFA